MAKNDGSPRAGAFTLVEMILVMALLSVILALSAPSLTGSLRQRKIEQEAARLLGMTESARDEAVSQGIPMDLWINTATGWYGVDAKTGYTAIPGRIKQYALDPDLQIDPIRNAAARLTGGVTFAEFAPDGTLDPSSASTLRISDRSKSALDVTQTTDGWAYEIVKEGR